MIEKVFRDPVHNFIHISDQVIQDLIDTKEFQRLRRIKQLGTTSFTFHGGEHSRFSHCLGAYEIARQVTLQFEKEFSDIWETRDSLIVKCATLLHDIGHGPYSHTFEHLFNTDHEAMTCAILTDPSTEVFAVLSRVSPDFPEMIASVIDKSYPNPLVVQLISSQIDVDRMDYLLRDSYFTGTHYGEFDLTRILRLIQPTKNGIVFKASGMHAIEDYIISRYQMYMQVYFHPASRSMEVLLANLLERAQNLYPAEPDFFRQTSPRLLPFLEQHISLNDYLELDDGVMNTYFQAWINAPDSILSNLASRYVNRHIFTSITFQEEQLAALDSLRQLVADSGFDPEYYTGIHRNFDLPYDIYRPDAQQKRTQIELIEADGSIIELSSRSALVAALLGTIHGDARFYFPKEMLEQGDLFSHERQSFLNHISNGRFIERH